MDSLYFPLKYQVGMGAHNIIPYAGQDNVVIVDTRPAKEYAKVHVAGAFQKTTFGQKITIRSVDAGCEFFRGIIHSFYVILSRKIFFEMLIIYFESGMVIRRMFFMSQVNRIRRRAFVNQSDCVACGCCVKVCPREAIYVVRGIAAEVDPKKCIGCGKCARECPATVIIIEEAAS